MQFDNKFNNTGSIISVIILKPITESTRKGAIVK